MGFAQQRLLLLNRNGQGGEEAVLYEDGATARYEDDATVQYES